MTRTKMILSVLLLASMSLACAKTVHWMRYGDDDGKGGSKAARQNMVVQINNMSLAPHTVRVTEKGNSIAWDNWSSYIAVVSFPLSIKDGFTCSELRPDFARTAERIESVVAIGDNEDLVTPCPLKLGTYDYEVYLSNSLANRDNPQLTLKGQIEVVP
jgi:hypothetical protein